MPASYKTINQEDLADTFDETHVFALDVLVGLSQARKSISSKYLYDERGSKLFRDITELPEYYLTSCELEILQNRDNEFARQVCREPFNLVELGAGYSDKTKTLLQHLLDIGCEFRYVPLDISESSMKILISDLEKDFPNLEITGIVSDYFKGLRWLNNRYPQPNFVLFLGSSIGNFAHDAARFFMRNVWTCLNDGDLMMIGFDLKKDIELFLDAYNDSTGVTSAFNLNVLDRINRELQGEFDLSKFRHFGTYDVFSGAMESYLVSIEKQEVYIGMIGRSFSFKEWEPIHTEYSYKYLMSDIETLCAETGFRMKQNLFDSRRYFVDSIWEVNKR